MRLLLGDTDATGVAEGQGEFLFYSDTEIEGLLALFGDPKRAAAHALRTIAASQTLLLKKYTSADLAVDGPALSKELRLLAADLELQAAAGDKRENADVFLIAGGESACDTTWQTDYLCPIVV